MMVNIAESFSSFYAIFAQLYIVFSQSYNKESLKMTGIFVCFSF